MLFAAFTVQVVEHLVGRLEHLRQLAANLSSAWRSLSCHPDASLISFSNLPPGHSPCLTHIHFPTNDRLDAHTKLKRATSSPILSRQPPLITQIFSCPFITVVHHYCPLAEFPLYTAFLLQYNSKESEHDCNRPVASN